MKEQDCFENSEYVEGRRVFDRCEVLDGVELLIRKMTPEQEQTRLESTIQDVPWFIKHQYIKKLSLPENEEFSALKELTPQSSEEEIRIAMQNRLIELLV